MKGLFISKRPLTKKLSNKIYTNSSPKVKYEMIYFRKNPN